MKILFNLLLFLSLLLNMSFTSYVYCELTLFGWFQNHRSSQGLPWTIDLQIAEKLAYPVYVINNNRE